VSVQAHILELLEVLQRETGIAYVLVSHDLSVVANFAHEVLVLRNGRVVEQGSVERIFTQPASDYTRELIAAIPGRQVTATAA
jgi:peptide/nickel transport system ATP-binding protein